MKMGEIDKYNLYDNQEEFGEDDELSQIRIENFISKYRKEIEEEDQKYAIEYYNNIFDKMKDINIEHYIADMNIIMNDYSEDDFDNIFKEEHTHFSEMLHYLILDEQYEKCILVKKLLDAIENAYSEHLYNNSELKTIVNELL